MTKCEVNGRQCHIFGDKRSDSCIICGMENHAAQEIKNTVEILYGRITSDKCKLVVFETDDWNGDFSPWQAEAIFGGKAFGGNAPATLKWMRQSLLPFLRESGALQQNDKIYLAGYSLSGLFALWAYLASDMFDGAAGCSGSLWFPGWMNYMGGRKFCRRGIVYLSLGSREEKTKNKIMAAIGDNTRKTCRILQNDPHIAKAALEWNRGGHFANPPERLARGNAVAFAAGKATYARFDGLKL